MKKSIKYAVVGGSILTLGVLTFFIGRRIYRKRKTKSILGNIVGKSDENKTSQTQLDNSENLDKYNPTSDAKVLESFLKGANALYYPQEVSKIIMPLSDSETIALSNEYKKRNGITLWEQLDGEWDACGFPIPKNCYEAPMKKLKDLNLV
ncbi:MAG: hypothetical protein ABF244_00610 [Flavobacteriaceae bacterium]